MFTAKLHVSLMQAFSGVSPGGVSASLRAVRGRLEGRNQAGFITNKEWHRIMDTKVGGSGLGAWFGCFIL